VFHLPPSPAVASAWNQALKYSTANVSARFSWTPIRAMRA
jgi:hypothetical protein